MIKVLKGFLKGFRFTLYGLVLIGLLPYFNASIYDFPETKPFSGDNFFNPYLGLENSDWYVGNFHAHANAWYGTMNGKGTNDDLYRTFLDSMGYDILGISNYQKPDVSPEHNEYSIPTYEHGYGLAKIHHIVIGAETASWMEYPFFQTIHHKQHILNHLRDRDDIVLTIAHPRRRNGFSLDDVKKLTGYDCMETWNRLMYSRDHWDAALSAGKPVFMMSNDDTHDYSHVFDNGRNATLISMESFTHENLKNALKKGQSIGVEIYTADNETYKRHKKRVHNLERVESVRMIGDTLHIQTNKLADFKLYGQNGEVKQTYEKVALINYPFKEDDTYIRAEIFFVNSWNTFYLNPVFRIEGDTYQQQEATVNALFTILYYLVMIALLGAVVYLIYYVEFRRRRVR